MINNILLSVVIPTFGRPDFLPRSIDSALNSCVDPDSVEVIVVPNGPDVEWKNIRDQYLDDPRVKFYFCEKSHGNSARNLGLKKAQGEFIRFLDDDDYLYAEGAKNQLSLAIKEELDWVSGMIEIVDNNKKYGLCSFPDSEDLFCAVMPVSGMSLPTGNLIRRNKIKTCWDESINKSQDYIFLIDLVMSDSFRWRKIPDVVGCWFQHDSFRVSDNIKGSSQKVNYNAFNKLEVFKSYLEGKNLFDVSRKKFYSKCVWVFIFANYDLDKVKVKKIAYDKVNEGYVNNDLYKKSKLTSLLSPIVKENPIFMLKLKWLVKLVKKIKNQENNHANNIKKI